eukprot:m.322096 g.322096  ORF g.322096 m.322096 type:complete len:92 (-) comp26379_c0_seq1:19-294(-)
MLGRASCIRLAPLVRHYRKGIHPRLYDVTVVHSNGSTFTLKMTKNLGIVKLTEDIHNSFPWVPQQEFDITGQVSRFEKKHAKHKFKIPGQK